MPWWDDRWLARVVATVDNGPGSENLVGFVLPIDVGELDTAGASADGADIRVFDDEGSELPYALENWGSASGSIIWVRLPTLGSGEVGRELSVYFANPNAQASEARDEVWSDYRAVYHLADDRAGQMLNAAADPIDGVITGTTEEAGILAVARRFTRGVASQIDFGEASHALFSGWDRLSLSMWIYPDYASDADWGEPTDRVLTRGGPVTFGRSWNNGSDTDSEGFFQIDFAFASGDNAYRRFDVPRQAWSWVVYDFDGTNLRQYLDGQLYSEFPLNPTALAATSQPMTLGGDAQNDALNAMNGLIDEFRVTNASRSAQWYDAQHRAMTGAMVTLGDVERCE